MLFDEPEDLSLAAVGTFITSMIGYLLHSGVGANNIRLEQLSSLPCDLCCRIFCFVARIAGGHHSGHLISVEAQEWLPAGLALSQRLAGTAFKPVPSMIVIKNVMVL